MHPTLVMRGLSKTDISNFSISAEDKEITLSEGINFIDAFDYLVKAFYIFNFDFPNEMKLVYTFIIKYVYEIPYNATTSQIEEKQFGLKMKDLRDKLATEYQNM